jgi:hypothetical protein
MEFHCKRKLNLYNIKSDLEETWSEYMNWINLTYNTFQWQVGFVTGMVLS